jgi:hypothetical protein
VTSNATYLSALPTIYEIEAENTGDEPTSAKITLEDVLPAGLTDEAVEFYSSSIGIGFGGDLALAHCPSLLKCEYPTSLPPIPPEGRLLMVLQVSVQPGFEGQLEDLVKLKGGGTGVPSTQAVAANAANANPPFAVEHLLAGPENAGSPYVQAAGHPEALAVSFDLPTVGTGVSAQRGIVTVGDVRNIVTQLPPGLIGDPQAVPQCDLALYANHECPLKTVVGWVGTRNGSNPESYLGGLGVIDPLFNLRSSSQSPGQLGFFVNGVPVILSASLRSGSDYGIDIASSGIPTGFFLNRVHVVTWGVPAAGSHDALRGKTCGGAPLGSAQHIKSIARQISICEGIAEPVGGLGGPAGVPPSPFLTMPTSCPGQPLGFAVAADTWEDPGQSVAASASSVATAGCDQLRFEPTISAQPTTNRADAPAGLDFHLEVPQECWREKPTVAEVEDSLCQSNLHEAVVKLPAGLAVNPSSANGLAACSPAQIGLETPVGVTPAHFSETPAQCPDASKIGTAEVKTPLLHEVLGREGTSQLGAVYLAKPHQNPFGSFLAGYIVLEGQGLTIKLPGRIETDPATGQITGRFMENPDVPFEDFHLRFFGGANGDLRTPPTCGSYETTSSFTPYSAPESGPPAEPASSFQLDNGGAPCPRQSSEQPNAPVFRAGTESPLAGAFSPFSLKLVREDGSQELAKIDTTLPPGLVGKLAGVGECSDAQLAAAAAPGHSGKAEQANPSCPASTEVGTVQVGAGAGPTPLYVSGHAYLAGPYKGAPLSLAVITPAVAGPFDLGDVVVRTALHVDPETAQIHAVSDEIPHILEGIPLDVRSITLQMSRPNFTLNPTNCEELGFSGSETSVLGNVAPLSQRFQVGGCQALPFKPKLSISLKGGTTRSGTPALKAVLKMPPGNANVAFAQVTLPHSEFLDQAHLENICTQVAFKEGGCPPSSVYGHAVAYTPLLDHPLEGPVYLMSGFGHKLPDLAADLNGQIRVLLHSKVDSVHESLRNTFEVVPDAPVSKFVLTMKGGKHSLIENSTDICRHRQRVTGLFRGQNGKSIEVNPLLQVHCKGKGRHKHGKKGHRRH